LKNKGLEKYLIDLYSFYSDWFGHNETISVQSSGSTGPPKTIVFNKRQLVESARQTGSFFNLKNMQNVLLCLPTHFIAGKMMVVRALVYNLDIITVKPSSTPLKNFHQKIGFAAMTPQQVFSSLQDAEDFLNINTLIIGGGEVSDELQKRLQALSTACYATYGMTETLTHIAVRKLNGTNIQNTFVCLPGIKIKTDNRDCLIVSANYLSKEIITNDIVELVTENEFRWIGRHNNVINSGGIKINPEKIEKTINSFFTGNFFISSQPDPVFGEKVIMIIEGSEPSEEIKNSFFDKLKNKLPAFHCPKEIYYTPELIYTTSGKINRKQSLAKSDLVSYF
ncbi:MAG: AMP-binding protein, partial [Bacteroidota bacterium]|nr:AMP-binding protein [Bacteroidota bacterium]